MSELGYPTLKERVYHKLREILLSGIMLPGTQIDERELAEKLAISRTPLREAISTLANEGVIEYRPYRGNFIRSFTVQQVVNLYEVRKALESLAVKLAVPKLADEDLKVLISILEDIKAALEQRDLKEFSRADRRFHATIAQFSGNETLIASLDRLELQIQIIRTIANRDLDVVERTMRERPQILAALKARDAELAARLMEEHIEGVCKAVVGQLKAYEQQDIEAVR